MHGNQAENILDNFCLPIIKEGWIGITIIYMKL